MINPANTQPKIIVAIPAYNEAHFIVGIVTNAKRYASQIIVVDDGSTDGTRQAADASGALVLRHEMNEGYGISIRHCFKSARENNADILVTIDGDGQHNPAEIPKLIDPILRGEADLVIGSRFHKSPQGTPISLQTGMPRYRKLGIAIINWLFNIGSRVKVSDAQSGFRAYSRSVFDNMVLTERGMAISVEILEKAREKGAIFKEVSICCNYELNSHSLNPLSHGLTVALSLIRLRFKTLLGKLRA